MRHTTFASAFRPSFARKSNHSCGSTARPLGNRAYSSWYGNGVVAIDLSDPTRLARVGQFVPDTSNRHANSLGVGPAEVWGVAVDSETGVVYASDMRTGLWILKPIGPAIRTR